MLKYYPRYIAVRVIKFYQKTFSPDHGLIKYFYPFGRCRYQPTCSEYATAAIEKYGLFSGGLKACWRVLRCNPWSKGGWDPVN
jgi:putative membrane protein insertion efficiency factor